MRKFCPIHFMFICFIFCLSSCNTCKNDNILLRVGDFEFSAADYEMMKSRMNNQITPSQLEKLIINNAYILAFAKENRYDTISEISKKLEYGMKLYSAEVNGFVWNKKIKPLLKITPDQLKEAYNKRKQLYEIEVISYPLESGNNLLKKKDNVSLNREAFNFVEESSDTSLKFSYSKIRTNYPYGHYGAFADELSNAKEGDIVGPFEIPGQFVAFHIKSVTNQELPSFKSIEEDLGKELIHGLTQKYIWENQNTILRKARPEIEEHSVNTVAQNFDKHTKSWKNIENDTAMMIYRFNNKVDTLTIRGFIEYVLCKPFILGDPSKPEDLKQMLNNYLFDNYLYTEAQALDAETDDTFITFNRYYTNKLFIQHFYKEFVSPHMRVTPEEVQAYYHRNSQNFISFDYASADIYKFRDCKSANKGWKTLNEKRSFGNKDTSSLNTFFSKMPGFISFTPNFRISINDNDISPEILNGIAACSSGQIMIPVESNGEFWVCLLNQKEGNSPMPFRVAKPVIEQKMPNRKAQEFYNKELEKLKEKYLLSFNKITDYNKNK
jgi:hypothetical protein